MVLQQRSNLLLWWWFSWWSAEGSSPGRGSWTGEERGITSIPSACFIPTQMTLESQTKASGGGVAVVVGVVGWGAVLIPFQLDNKPSGRWPPPGL